MSLELEKTRFQEIVPISSVSLLKAPVRLSNEKANDIKSMLCFMPAIDCTFYETILKQKLNFYFTETDIEIYVEYVEMIFDSYKMILC